MEPMCRFAERWDRVTILMAFAFCLIYRGGKAIAELSASIQFRRVMAAYYSILTLKINGLADLKTIIYFREVLLQLLLTSLNNFFNN